MYDLYKEIARSKAEHSRASRLLEYWQGLILRPNLRCSSMCSPCGRDISERDLLTVANVKPYDRIYHTDLRE